MDRSGIAFQGHILGVITKAINTSRLLQTKWKKLYLGHMSAMWNLELTSLRFFGCKWCKRKDKNEITKTALIRVSGNTPFIREHIFSIIICITQILPRLPERFSTYITLLMDQGNIFRVNRLNTNLKHAIHHSTQQSPSGIIQTTAYVDKG